MGDTGFNGSADDVTMSSTTTVTVHINPSQGPECKLVRSACIFLYLLSINLHPSAWTFKLLGIRGCGLTRSVKCVKPEPMPCVVYSVSSRAASGSASSISDLPSMQRGGRRGRKKKGDNSSVRQCCHFHEKCVCMPPRCSSCNHLLCHSVLLTGCASLLVYMRGGEGRVLL